MMRLKKSREQEIEDAIKSFADALGVDVSVLKETQVSLVDIITIKQDAEALKAFSSARSAWRSGRFYMVKLLLKLRGKLPHEKDEE